jgi:chromate reductase, NAD(P)H dehydrogenase (quinone)
MATIVGVAGSLRRNSYNTALLQAARDVVPVSSTLRIESIAEIPLYNFDVEEQAFPGAVTRLKNAIAESDGLLLVTPEYNNSIPGVFKNAIDWCSRPGSDIKRVFGGLHVAVIGASPGRYGTILSQAAWLPVLRALQTRPWFEGRLQIADAETVFDEKGNIAAASSATLLANFMREFTSFVERNPRRRETATAIRA